MKKLFNIFAAALIALSFASCGDGNDPDQPIAKNGLLPGKFSVSETEYVRFSQGNLQFNAVQGTYIDWEDKEQKGTWRFAENQWDIIGKDNQNIAPDYDGWIDLFGWGTGDDPTKATDVNSDYTKTFTNWGSNAISNGGNQPHMWKVMSKDKWNYLLFERPDAGEGLWHGLINGIYGLILLPDNIEELAGGNKFDMTSIPDAGLSIEQWKELEKAGAVFLPFAGRRDPSQGNEVSMVNMGLFYWTNSYKKETEGVVGYDICDIEFFLEVSLAPCRNGHSVRLVQFEEK